LKTTVFWDMKPCPIFLDYSEDAGSKVLRKFGTYTRIYMITYHRSRESSFTDL